MNKLLLLLLLLLTNIFAFENSIDISNPQYGIGKKMLWYEDKSANLDFHDIRKLSHKDFKRVKSDIDSHFFTESAYWYTFEVTNKQKSILQRYLVFSIAWLDNINVTIINSDKSISSYSGGDMMNFEHRSIQNRFTNFEHRFQPGTSRVYVQVKTRDPFIVPISIVDKEEFLLKDKAESISVAFIYGVILAMLFYNLFLYFSIKVDYYIYYVFYLGLFLIANTFYTGHSFELLFSTHPSMQNFFTSSTLFLFSIAGLFFAKSFLDLKTNNTKLNALTNLLIILFFLSMAVTFFFGYRIHVITALVFIIVFSLFVSLLAVYSLLQGNKSARFFFLGTISGLIGSSITALTVMSFIPYSDFTFKAAEYGMVLDAILLSLAIADKIRISNNEKLIAQKEAKTDALTQLLNRRAYYNISKMEISKSERCGCELSLVLLDIDYFKKVNDSYGHDAGDLVLQELSKHLKTFLREYDYCFRLGGEEFALLLPQTNLEQAIVLANRIRFDIEGMNIKYESTIMKITVSLGVSQYQKGEKEIITLEKRADNALYIAKMQGRNQVVHA